MGQQAREFSLLAQDQISNPWVRQAAIPPSSGGKDPVSASGTMTRTDSISVTVTIPGIRSSTMSTIVVSTCGAGAGTCFLFRDRAFWAALPRVPLLVSALVLFLAADLLTTLDAAALACFFATVLGFPCFDFVTAGRLFRFAIPIP
jgi:hypothetical protein